MWLLLLCHHLTGQDVRYKVNHAVAATTFTPEQVASDFGLRLVPDYDWHGGIDYNSGGGGQIK